MTFTIIKLLYMWEPNPPVRHDVTAAQLAQQEVLPRPLSRRRMKGLGTRLEVL